VFTEAVDSLLDRITAALWQRPARSTCCGNYSLLADRRAEWGEEVGWRG